MRVGSGRSFRSWRLAEVKSTDLKGTQNKTAALEWLFGELCIFEYIQYAQLLVTYSHFDIIFLHLILVPASTLLVGLLESFDFFYFCSR
jgi:hypothetical protein